MDLMRRVVVSHAVTFAAGSLYLAWLALPLGDGAWSLDPTIHWGWLLAPALLLGAAAGLGQGIVLRFGRFWPTLVPLLPASLVALWSSALFVAPSLFGSEPEPPPPALLLSAFIGWTLFTAVALSVTSGSYRVVQSLRTRRATRDGSAADSVV